MVILALETVTRAGSLAWFEDGACVATAGDPSTTHGIRLPGELVAFAASRGRRLADVDVFSVITGPGSFTGLRIGLAAIQGVAFALGRRVIPVTTMDAIVSDWLDQHAEADGWIVPCQDAARGDVFFAVYDVRGAQVIEDAAIVVPASVAAPADAAARVAALHPTSTVVIVGDGVAAHGEAFARAIPDARLETAPVNLARGAARLAARHTSSAVLPHALKPEYVRKPDVELARERAARLELGEAARIAGARAVRPGEPADHAGPKGPSFSEIGPANVEITPASSPDDVRAVAALQARSFAEAWGADAMQRELEATDVARLYVARTSTGAVVAYCSCWIVVDELHINSVAVDPARRRRGIARQVMGHVLREAAAAGARSATLEVRASNAAARGLYEGMGFAVEAVRRDYYQNPREDGLILWRRGLASP